METRTLEHTTPSGVDNIKAPDGQSAVIGETLTENLILEHPGSGLGSPAAPQGHRSTCDSGQRLNCNLVQRSTCESDQKSTCESGHRSACEPVRESTYESGHRSTCESRQSSFAESTAEGGGESVMVVPPDGGWGWVVVLSSFVIHIMADGVAYSFGVFYVALLEQFGGGRGATGWIASLMVGVTLMSGPIASALTNKYGCRAVTIAGSLVSCLAFIVSIPAPNIYYLYVTLGFLAGFGLGLIYLPAIVSVTYYFERRRAFATGLAVCGSGIGTFIFAPLAKLLLDTYGWRGAMLIEAGLLLNCVACGMVFRSLEPTRSSQREQDPCTEVPLRPEVPLLTVIDEEEALPGDKWADCNGVAKQRQDSIQSDNDTTRMNGSAIRHPVMTSDESAVTSLVPRGFNASRRLSTSTPSLPLYLRTPSGHAPATPSPPVSQPGGNKSAYTRSEFNLTRGSSGGGAATAARQTSPRRVQQLSVTSATGLIGRRKDIFYSGSLANIPMYRSDRDLYHQSLRSLPASDVSLAAPDVTDTDRPTSCCPARPCHGNMLRGCLSPEMADTLSEMMDFSLLADWLFLLFAVSNLMTSIGFNTPYIFLPDRARLLGISETRAAALVSVIGVGNTAGRVLFGWLSDRPRVNRLLLYNTALLLCGVITALSSFCRGFALLVIYAFLFGAFIGVYVSLTSVVLVDLLGLDRLTNSFGLLLLFQGIATIIGPPIAGWTFDATGSYDAPFWIVGAMIALSGFILYFIPCVRRAQERRRGVRAHDVMLGMKVNQKVSRHVSVQDEDDHVIS